MRSSLVRSLLAVTCTLLAAALSATGCSSSSSSASAQVTAAGTVGGKAFSVGSAIATSGGTQASGPTIVVAVASGSEFALTCAEYISSGSSGGELADVSAFFFEITRGGSAVTAGNYSVDGSSSARVVAESVITDASCKNTGGQATAGTVTVTSVSATSVAGSYDLMLTYSPGGTDHVSGTFEAPLCDLPSSFYDQPTTDAGLSCQS
jgi:hypothetical protein